MKILELKKGCFIKPYINKQLEVIREGKRIIIYDGHTKKGDIIQLEDDLAKNILNTIFGNEVIAIEITKKEFKEILKEEILPNYSYNVPVLEDTEDEDVTDNTNTEETNNEEEVTTDNTNTEETNNEEEVTTDNTDTEETNNEEEVTTDNTDTEETNNEEEVTTDNTDTKETNNKDEEPKTNTGRRKRN